MPQHIYRSMEKAQEAWDRGEIEGDEDYWPGYHQGMAGLARCRHCDTKEPLLYVSGPLAINVLCAECYEKYTGVVYEVYIPDADGLVDSILVRMGKVVGGKWIKE